MDQRRSIAWALTTCTALLVLLMAMLPTASGQSMTGQISGVVLDPQSAVVPGATVTLTNAMTGQERQVTSGSQGEFVFTQLLAGEYIVRVNAPGFKVYEQTGLNLSSNERLVARGVQLELGTTSETVEVSAEAGHVETQSSERVGSVTSTQIAEIAVSPDRNFMSLLKVVPGVTDAGGRGATVLGGRSGQTIVTLDGIVDNDTGVQNTGAGWVQPNIDAISEMKVMLTNYTAEYGVRSGGTINVAIKNGTQDFHGSAYYFKRHEMFNANSWNNNRNNRDKSRYRYDNFGATLGGPVIFPGSDFNQSRDKLFFFVSLEWLKTKNPSGIRRVRVPSDLEREGDFSQTYSSYDNKVAGIPREVIDPLTGVQFPDNVVPSSRFDPVGYGYLNFYERENRTSWDSDISYNYITEWLDDSPKDEQIVRIDWNVAPKTLIYGRFIRTNAPQKSSTGFSAINIGYPLVGSTWNQHAPANLVTTWIQTFSASLVNEATIGFNRGIQTNEPLEGQLANGVRANIPGVNQFQQFHPELNKDDILPSASFGDGIQGISVNDRWLFHADNTLMNITDNLSWVKGAHSMKFGFYSEFTSRNSLRESINTGSFTFDADRLNSNPLETKLGMANALIGSVYRYQESDMAQWSQARYRDIEFYLQDSWRVNRRLTLDVGVRFQNIWPTWYKDQQVGMFMPSLYSDSTAMQYIYPVVVDGETKGKNPLTGEIVAPTYILSFAQPADRQYTLEEMYSATEVFKETYLNNPGWNVSPRFGFAYDVFGDGKMAIRGGFGMFYERSGGDDIQGNWLQVPPIQNLLTIYYSTISQLKSATVTYGPGDGRYAPRAAQRDFDTPGSYNWSFGIQRDLGLGVVLDVSYVGTVGRHLRREKGINSIPYGTNFLETSKWADSGRTKETNFLRPYRGYGGISYVSYDDSSNYHSMQLQLNRRFGDRLTASGFWTWSKVMDYAAGGRGGGTYLLPDELFYGKPGSDRTHNVVVNWTYRVPGLSSYMGDNIIAKGVFDGWQMSGIATFTSGTPQSVSWGIDGPPIDATGSDVTTTRVDIIGNPINDSAKTGIWSNLNTSAFAPPLYGEDDCVYGNVYTCGIGNAAKDVFRGPGINNWDISFFKNFQLGSDETRSLQFRFETYNTFNHTQYSGLDTSARFNADTGAQVNSTFGQYNGAQDNRRMVFALKLKF